MHSASSFWGWNGFLAGVCIGSPRHLLRLSGVHPCPAAALPSAKKALCTHDAFRQGQQECTSRRDCTRRLGRTPRHEVLRESLPADRARAHAPRRCTFRRFTREIKRELVQSQDSPRIASLFAGIVMQPQQWAVVCPDQCTRPLYPKREALGGPHDCKCLESSGRPLFRPCGRNVLLANAIRRSTFSSSRCGKTALKPKNVTSQPIWEGFPCSG